MIAELIPGHKTRPGFDVILLLSMRRQWFTCVRLTVPYVTFLLTPFSSTLTTRALNPSSLRSFKASPCRAALEDLPPSLRELHTSSLKDSGARGTRSVANSVFEGKNGEYLCVS